MRARGQGETEHQAQVGHANEYSAVNLTLQGLLERLSAGQAALSTLANLPDQQLDTVPPAGDMKFCDGQRTLDQVLTSLLRHQDHQVEALRAALA